VESNHSLLIEKLKQALVECKTEQELIKIKADFLGKNGSITKEFEQIKFAEDKKATGQVLNSVKNEAEELIKACKSKFEKIIEDDYFDISQPGRDIKIGTRHPITLTINDITKIFNSYGFSEVSGKEIETEFYNFEALNIPKNHPARDMHDTFYVDVNNLLRTHTSSVQIHSMLKYKAPLKIMTPGKVYRCDSDPTHSPMFHQIEGLYIDKNVNFCHLKGILIQFINDYFGSNVEIRFRPSYFPFTEPSAELDIKFRGKWLEVLGCGMVHNSVLENVKISTKRFTGFAFGLGVERLAMLKYDIKDLRLFYENDMNFLRQFEGIK
tara:strand:- start:4951 stop:5922 length:972 start_codon:yes stop_codon:yes gene_type:complete